MTRSGTFGLLLAAGFAGSSPASVGAHRGHHAARHHFSHRYAATIQPYASRVLSTPTCRYPDGTPYDPDIIGGANHVGDGGPAANLGGFNPCGS